MIGISTIASFVLGNEWTRLAAIAVLCFGFGWVKGWGAVPRVDVAQVQRVAAEARDNEWKARLADEERAHESRIEAAIEVGKSIAATPGDAAERMRVCKSDASCRERKGG